MVKSPLKIRRSEPNAERGFLIPLTKYRKKGLWSPDDGALFFPMEFTSAQSVPEIHEMPVCSDPVPVELRLSNGRCLRFDNRLDAAMLTQLIRAVEAA